MVDIIRFNQRDKALAISIALLTMAVLAVLAFGLVMPMFNNLMSTSDLRLLMMGQENTYAGMLVLIGLIIVLDFLLSVLIADFFKNINRKLAFYAGLLRFAYSILFGVALCFLLSGFLTNEVHAADFWINMKRFYWLWNLSLGFLFGPHLILTAFLMKQYKIIPVFVWGLTAFAGFAYVIVHVLKIFVPQWATLELIEMILILPMVLGELLLAFWVLIKVAFRSSFN